MADSLETERTRLRRKPSRGAHNRDAIYAILDDGFVCHVGFSWEEQPYVLPMVYARDGDLLLLHGAQAGRMFRTLAAGVPVCATVTLLDGLVLARSARMHSVNYRSAVVLGEASEITDHVDKTAALKCIVERVIPGRWRDVRQPNPRELRETTLLALPIREASAKSRSGPPIDYEDDYAASVWAGEIPLVTIPLAPLADTRLAKDSLLPEYVKEYVDKVARGATSFRIPDVKRYR